MQGENRHTQIVRLKVNLYFEEDKRAPVFPLFVVVTIHHTLGFLFVLSSVYRVSVSCFFILYWICFLVILLVRIEKSLLFFQLSVIKSAVHKTILFKIIRSPIEFRVLTLVRELVALIKIFVPGLEFLVQVNLLMSKGLGQVSFYHLLLNQH